MKLITTIHKLPLSTFIDCICDNDLSGLGDGTEAERSFVWNDLLEQYGDALQDDGNKRYILVVKEYQQAKTRYELANTYIELLNNYFSQGVVVPKWIKELNSMIGSNYVFNKEKIEDFSKYLTSALNRNKGNMIRYNLAKSKLEEIIKINSNVEGGKYDRAYFIKVLVNLKDMKGREIPYTISTYEFCVLVNQLKKFIIEQPIFKNGRS